MAAPASAEAIRDVNTRYHDAAAREYDYKWGIDFHEIGRTQVLGKLHKALGRNPGPFPRALEIGAGTGYFSLNLLQAGVIGEVTPTDISPGMLAALSESAASLGLPVETAACEASALPFEDGSFDVVTCRIAAHHFSDVAAAVMEMARVSNRLLVIEDNLFRGEHVEEAERLRDPTHVRCYSEDEWRQFLQSSGFEVEQLEHFPRRQSFTAWLERVDTPPQDATRIRELLADHIEDDMLDFASIVLKARKSQR